MELSVTTTNIYYPGRITRKYKQNRIR